MKQSGLYLQEWFYSGSPIGNPNAQTYLKFHFHSGGKNKKLIVKQSGLCLQEWFYSGSPIGNPKSQKISISNLKPFREPCL